MAAFAAVEATTGEVFRPSAKDCAERFPGVPALPERAGEIATLFAVAQGVMPHGYFFYSLFTLGEEQFYRVADAATRHKYREQRGHETSGRPPPYARRVGWLHANGFITADELGSWKAYVELRNIASHPVDQTHSSRPTVFAP